MSVRHRARGKKISMTTSRHMCAWSSSASSSFHSARSSPPLVSRPFVALIFSVPPPRHLDPHGNFNVSLRSSLETSPRRRGGSGKGFFVAIRVEYARPGVLEFSRYVVTPQKAPFSSAMTATFFERMNENAPIFVVFLARSIEAPERRRR